MLLQYVLEQDILLGMNADLLIKLQLDTKNPAFHRVGFMQMYPSLVDSSNLKALSVCFPLISSAD